MSHLVPCSTCARHVRASEPVCPFCASTLSDALRAAVPGRRPTGRLTRAALYAFGATSLTLATACSSSSTPETSDGSAKDVMTSPEAMPAYGGPFDATLETGDDGPTIPEGGALYGCPPDVCDVEPADAGADGPGDADAGFTAAYGGPSLDASH